ncbi:MAG: hypothetical protein MZU79_05500 [Anaerotruncus sp.]|nr:hypothetical protein [Anaerotruncus sp.]
MYKFYTWGLNVREFYLPGPDIAGVVFRDNPRLFWVNAPLRMLNETWVTVKRWFPFYPLKTLLLIPLFLLYRAAWAMGIAVGAHRYFKKQKGGHHAGTVKGEILSMIRRHSSMLL